MSVQKRGQFAFEFIMTYGWAIMVLALVLAGLSYLFINQTDPFPERCALGPGLHCYTSIFKHRTFADRDLAILTVQVINNMGKDISDLFIAMDPENSFCGGWTAVGAWAASPYINYIKKPIKNGEIRNFLYHPDATGSDMEGLRDVIVCDCIDEGCPSIDPAVVTNCCASDLSKAYLGGFQTLCPTYDGGINVNTCIEFSAAGAQKRLRSQLTTTYREKGSSIFHQRKGFIDLPNVGKF